MAEFVAENPDVGTTSDHMWSVLQVPPGSNRSHARWDMVVLGPELASKHAGRHSKASMVARLMASARELGRLWGTL